MKIQLKNISIKDITKNYIDNQEEGIFWYNGKLNIRPKYQREFVYKDDKRNAVIDTIKKDFPLNVMYWVKNEDNTYEVLDGQQRIISFCQYINGDFSILENGNALYFKNLSNDKKEKILNYECMIYFCEGTDSEKLEWFKTINIAGEKLTDQELRNAIYTWSRLTDAKRHFSKTGCPAYQIGEKYITGSTIRQEYLETALKWLSKNSIEQYMANHQYDENANELWLYFQSVINWVKTIFSNYRKEMKGISRGELYNQYGEKKIGNFEIDIVRLMQDEDITNKKGIYEYLLSWNEKCLNIRNFSENMKRESYEKQQGICVKCQEYFEFNEMEADHITPRSQGGKTTTENCQILCKECNRRKSNK